MSPIEGRKASRVSNSIPPSLPPSLPPTLPPCLPSSRSGSATAVHQGRVVQRLDITIDIQRTNCYAVDSVLLGGQRYQTFEQLEPDKSLVSIDKRKV